MNNPQTVSILRLFENMSTKRTGKQSIACSFPTALKQLLREMKHCLHCQHGCCAQFDSSARVAAGHAHAMLRWHIAHCLLARRLALRCDRVRAAAHQQPHQVRAGCKARVVARQALLSCCSCTPPARPSFQASPPSPLSHPLLV